MGCLGRQAFFKFVFIKKLYIVDTSVWIEYFRGGNNFEKLDFLIDENLVVINDLILAELIPFLKIKNHRKVIKLLNHINKLEIHSETK